MTTPKRYSGRVNYTPLPQSCYVRVNIPQDDGIPLSIKATFLDYNWRDFKKDDRVEVERSSKHDARHFRITRLLKEVLPKEENPCSEIYLEVSDTVQRQCNITVRDKEDFLRQQHAVFFREKTMSKDRVRFWLGEQYLRHNSIYDVLDKAFDLCEIRARTVSKSCAENGFWIICCPDQFARFLIYRNAAGGLKNGFMDLQATLFIPETPDYYTQMAHQHNIPRETVKAIVLSLGYGHDWLKGRMSDRVTGWPMVIDVSQRHTNPNTR